MGCNGWNHPPDCNCGWGGWGWSAGRTTTNGGGYGYSRERFYRNSLSFDTRNFTQFVEASQL